MATFGFRELLVSTDATSFDFQDKGSRSREFLADTASADAAKAHPLCPQRNDPHPIDSKLRCDRLDTRPNGSGGTFITAWFSNDRRFASGRSPNRDRAAVREDWGWSSRDVTVRIPMSIYNTMILPDPTTGTPRVANVWELAYFTHTETRVQRPLALRIPRATNYATLDQIAFQNRRIHTIGGKRWQFLVDGNAVRTVDDATYEVRYLWELDRGTLMPEPRLGPKWFFSARTVAIDPITNRRFIREPYGVFVVNPPDDPETGVFEADQTFPYIEDPDGWRLLPGVPNL